MRFVAFVALVLSVFGCTQSGTVDSTLDIVSVDGASLAALAAEEHLELDLSAEGTVYLINGLDGRLDPSRVDLVRGDTTVSLAEYASRMNVPLDEEAYSLRLASDTASLLALNGGAPGEVGASQQALSMGGGSPIGRTGFTCSLFTCECTGDIDCNDMFESDVCPGDAMCDDDTGRCWCSRWGGKTMGRTMTRTSTRTSSTVSADTAP